MTIEELMNISTSLAGVTSDIKWEDHLCFNVAEKIFLLTSPDELPPTACFKVTGEQFDELAEREGYRQAPHFAKRQWVLVDDIGRMDAEEWEIWIRNSYRLVASKLSGKKRRELGIELI